MDGVLAAASTSCRVDEQKQQSEHELRQNSRTEEPKGVYGFLVASNVFRSFIRGPAVIAVTPIVR